MGFYYKIIAISCFLGILPSVDALRWKVCNRSHSGTRRHLTALGVVSSFRDRRERHLWAVSSALHPRRRPRGAAPEGRSLTRGRTLLVTHSHWLTSLTTLAKWNQVRCCSLEDGPHICEPRESFALLLPREQHLRWARFISSVSLSTCGFRCAAGADEADTCWALLCFALRAQSVENFIRCAH
jgi:hypothetical protein